ncbi:hypothetical protein AAE478_010630 [Parahypoxylon ruwenzoriense]
MSGRGAPGANSRGRGGKFKKFTRGGGKHYSRDLRPLDAEGNEISMWSEDAQRADDGSEEEGSEEDDSEEEDSDAGPSQQKPEVTREERKQVKKAQKEAAIAKKKKAVQVGDMPTDSEEDEDDEDDSMPANPNHSKAARNMTKAQSTGVDEATEGVKNLAMSRKERESIEAQQAKERYRKLHEAGKTDEAKADLARLRLIREKREAEAARKQAEKEEKEAHENARKAEIEAKEAKKREAALGKPGKGRAK